MKKYVSPEITVNELEIANIIAATFTEGSEDNETSWLDKWNSGISKAQEAKDDEN